jgi:TP901 family phage tail tape measure protein
MSVYQTVIEIIGRDQASAEVAKLAENIGKMAAAVRKSVSDAASSFRELGEKVSDAGKQITSFGKSWSLNISAPIFAIGGAIAKFSGDFEAGMNRVAAVSGATEAELEQLKAQAIDLGAKTVFSASQATEGMRLLATAGFNVNEIMAATPGVMQLAAAGAVDLSTAADIAASTLRAFGLQASEIQRVNDVLTKTFVSTNTNIVGLGESMKYVAPVAAAMGISLESTAAAIGVLGNAGFQGSMAGTILRNVLADITTSITPTGEALNSTGEKMQALGLNFYDSSGKVKDFAGIVAELQEKGVSAAQIMDMFGERAGPGLVALVSQGSEALTTLTGRLEEAGGTAQEIADKQMEGFRGQLEQLKGALESLAIKIGESGVLKDLTKFVEKMTSFVEKLNQTNPELLKMILYVGLVVAAMGPAIIIVGKVTTAIGGLMTAVGWIIGHLGGLSSVLAVAGSALSAIGEVVLGIVAAAITPFGLALGALIASMALLGYTISKHWDDIKYEFSEAWKSIKAWLKDAVETVKGWGEAIGEKISETLSRAWDWVKEKFQAMIDWVKGLGKRMWEAGKELWEQFTDGIKAVFEKPIELVKEGLAKIRDMLPFSPAKEGPLVTLREGGAGIMNEVAAGIEEGSAAPVTAAWKTLATINSMLSEWMAAPQFGGTAAMLTRLPMTSQASAPINNITLNVNGPLMGNEADARLLARQISQYTSTEARR